MRSLRITSKWLVDYIKEKGNIAYITLQMTLVGWWGVYEAPSVLMGRPSKKDDFEEFQIIGEDDITIYIAKRILKNYVKNNSILVVLEGYGRYEIKLENS